MSDAPIPAGAGLYDRARPLDGSAPIAALVGVDPAGIDLDSRRDSLAEMGEAGSPRPPVDAGADRETLAICAKLEQNDTDNGTRLLAHFGTEILHVREVGWHTWERRVWKREGGDEAVTAYAQRTAKRIHAEVAHLEHLPAEAKVIAEAEPLRGREAGSLSKVEKEMIEAADDAIVALKGRRRSHHKFATTSGNGGKITAMIAQALPHKSVGPKDLDADDMLFNCENGTLRFRKVEDPDNIGDHAANYKLDVKLLEHDRRHLITKMAPVSYDRKATCPKFLAFMERFQPIPSIRKFLQVYHGLALTGETGQQCFIYNHGNGANGKSTFMEAMAELFGEYSDLLNAESLTGQGQRRGDQATPDFAELPGVRYLRVSELPRGEDLKEALVKQLTGGEEIKARHLNKGFFKYLPKFKAAMSGNDLPKIGGVDNGIWRRVKLVPWAVTIADGERRPMNEILAEFKAERAGILNWLLDGLDIFMREGLRTPTEVAEATAAYREEMDPIGAFAADCIIRCEPEEGAEVTARAMFEAFQRWCDANSVRPWKETAFGRAMPHKGFERVNARVRKYVNVRLDLTDLPPLQTPRNPSSGGGYGA